VNRNELIKELMERTPCNRERATDYLETFEEVITESVAKGDAVMLTGFVKFERKDRPARQGRNPATGETIQIAAKSVVKVTPLKKFKDAVMAAAPKPSAKKGGRK
jgi:DNA-binding protein HU-beta